jgi:hypothetical protein
MSLAKLANTRVLEVRQAKAVAQCIRCFLLRTRDGTGWEPTEAFAVATRPNV